jgi:hypothetical protein
MSYIQELFTSRNNGTGRDGYVGKQGRIWWDPVTNCFYYSDGVTPGGIPIGNAPDAVFGELATETYTAADGQTEFEILHAPSGQVTGAINGSTMSAGALSENLVIITYDPALNDGYILRDGDQVTFSYLFGTANASTLAQLSDVHLTSPKDGSVLIYDGAMNLWVAGNPRGTLQYGIENGTTTVKIHDPNGSVGFTIAGFQNRMTIGANGINLKEAHYSVNGYLAVNGPSLQIENKNMAVEYDNCDRPVDVTYNQIVPADQTTLVEYARLCWDTASRFNPTANAITVGGATIQPWSWRPMIDGYYTVTARLTFDDPATPIGSAGTKLHSEGFLARAAQTVFYIQNIPKGTVVFVLNGATLPVGSYTINEKMITYVPAGNNGYVLLKGDEIGISYIIGGGPTFLFNSDSVVATEAQTEFTLSEAATGVVMASLNGATLPTYAMMIDGTSAVYSPVANDGYVLREDDVISFNYFVGSSGNKVLTAESFYARRGQLAFNLSEYPSGTVIASLNGAVLPPSATETIRKAVVYSAEGNGGYVLRADDVITFTYIGAESQFGSEDWAVLKIAVNGVPVSTGCKAAWVNKTIDVEVDTQLLLTPTDNISIQVFQHTDQPLRVLSSMLSATMIRGIE